MKNYVIAAIAFVFLACCGCLKNGIPGPDTTNTVPGFTFTPSKNPVVTPVNGNWQWIKSYGAEGGLSTPASTNSTMSINFKADSTVEEYRNGTLGLHENFSYLNSYTFFDNSVSAAVEINQLYYRPTISNDTLRLDVIVMADPSYSLFVKIK